MARVFLSHATPDKPGARRIAAALREAGHETWLDEEEVLVGESIPAAIERGLREADFVVLCMSNAAAERGWIEAERDATLMQQFSERKERILPVRLEKVAPPYLVASLAYVDLFPDEQAFARGIAQLARSIHAYAARHANTTRESGSTSKQASPLKIVGPAPPELDIHGVTSSGSGGEATSQHALRLLFSVAARVPGGKWVFGPVALAAATAVILGLFLGSTRLAFWGTTFVFVFVVLFYVFAKGTKHVKVSLQLAILVWVVTLLFSSTLITLYSCIFFGRPIDLSHWIIDSPSDVHLRENGRLGTASERPDPGRSPIQHGGTKREWLIITNGPGAMLRPEQKWIGAFTVCVQDPEGRSRPGIRVHWQDPLCPRSYVGLTDVNGCNSATQLCITNGAHDIRVALVADGWDGPQFQETPVPSRGAALYIHYQQY